MRITCGSCRSSAVICHNIIIVLFNRLLNVYFYEPSGKITLAAIQTCGESFITSIAATNLKSPTTHIVEAAIANTELMVNEKHVQA